MSSSALDPPIGLVHSRALELLDRFDAVIDGLHELELTALTDDAVIEVLRRAVRCERRVPAVRHGLVAEVEARAIPATKHCRTTGAFLRTLVNVSTGEGAQWARDARDLVTKRSLTTGEELPPPLPAVSAAVADGGISTVHARMIADTMREVPVAVDHQTRAWGETRLVRTARQSDPARLARACQDFLDRVDPDGTLDDDADRAHKRDFTIGRQGRDGMTPVKGRLDPETAALVSTVIGQLSAPQSTQTQPDLRTAGQRRHDALHEIARRILAAGDLPTRHGLIGTMLVTVALTDLERRAGHASTFSGGRVPVRDLLRIAADMRVIPVVLDSDGQVLHLGEEQRLATTAQRLALAVMDRGCTYPDCDTPAVWCQAAHGEPFVTSRRTSINDLALLCGYHHRILDRQEWTIERINGRVWLTPPDWLDRDRRPRTNEYFKPLDDTPV